MMLKGTPYTMLENIKWLWRNTVGPSRQNKNHVQFIPKDVDLNPITQYLNVGVIGDIMDMHSRTLHISENIKEFLKHCDLIIGNFEATITSQKRAGTRQKHEELIINTLEELFPPDRFFLSVANNHAGDYGYEEWAHSVQLLKDHGFNIFGSKTEPYVDFHWNYASLGVPAGVIKNVIIITHSRKVLIF